MTYIILNEMIIVISILLLCKRKSVKNSRFFYIKMYIDIYSYKYYTFLYINNICCYSHKHSSIVFVLLNNIGGQHDLQKVWKNR